jgi:hypothetical protein
VYRHIRQAQYIEQKQQEREQRQQQVERQLGAQAQYVVILDAHIQLCRVFGPRAFSFKHAEPSFFLRGAPQRAFGFIILSGCRSYDWERLKAQEAPHVGERRAP